MALTLDCFRLTLVRLAEIKSAAKSQREVLQDIISVGENSQAEEEALLAHGAGNLESTALDEPNSSGLCTCPTRTETISFAAFLEHYLEEGPEPFEF